MTLRVVDGGAVASDGWESKLRWKVSKAGSTLESCVSNVALVMIHDSEWRGVIGLDELSGMVTIRREPPWTADMRAGPTDLPRHWTDEDSIRLGAWFSAHRRWWCVVKTTVAHEGATVAAAARPFNAVREYLRSVEWDGVPRLDSWCSTYLGVEPSDYARTVGRLWIISGVARAMRPGCKADHVLILEGGQGAGKSTALRILFGDRWFLDTPISIGSKDAMQQLRGMWGVELPELDSLVRADRDSAKAFFSGRVDRYRPSYGRVVIEVPRTCIIAGTVNPGARGYLDDETGARRYWPVATGALDLAGLTRDRDQIWAEALAEYDEGRPWWPDGTLRVAIEAEQSDRYREDSWDAVVADWLTSGGAARASAATGGFTLGDVLAGALDLEKSKWDKPAQTRVGAILHRLGCSSRRRREGGSRWREYLPPDGVGLEERDPPTPF